MEETSRTINGRPPEARRRVGHLLTSAEEECARCGVIDIKHNANQFPKLLPCKKFVSGMLEEVEKLCFQDKLQLAVMQYCRERSELIEEVHPEKSIEIIDGRIIGFEIKISVFSELELSEWVEDNLPRVPSKWLRHALDIMKKGRRETPYE